MADDYRQSDGKEAPVGGYLGSKLGAYGSIRGTSGFSYSVNYGGAIPPISEARRWAKRRMNEAGYGLTYASLSRAEHSKILNEAAADARAMASFETMRYKMAGGA